MHLRVEGGGWSGACKWGLFSATCAKWKVGGAGSWGGREGMGRGEEKSEKAVKAGFRAWNKSGEGDE